MRSGVMLAAILILGLFVPIGGGHAQTANTITATCKDGTTFSGTKRYGACRGHGGVQSWGTAATSPEPAPTTTQSNRTAPTGHGQVWVNTASKVYHCPGTRYYGKTKQGEYMSEAKAKAQGDRPAYGKGCGS
jgi:hypothetical protein